MNIEKLAERLHEVHREAIARMRQSSIPLFHWTKLPEEWRAIFREVARAAVQEIKPGRIAMTADEKLKHCSGCEDDFYNGKNGLGVNRCWSLEKAKLIMRKEVHIDQVPPWNQKPKKMLSCFHRKRYVCVGPDQTHG